MSFDLDYQEDYCEDCNFEWKDCKCEPITQENCPHMNIELEELSDAIIWEVCQDCDKMFGMVGQFGVVWPKKQDG